ncbi:neuropeptide Y receptor type 5-like [Oppia nitens]|nr:neuropeptide Y receptor type 5-like [Oppia nitens]
MDPLVMQDKYLFNISSNSTNITHQTLPTLEALSDPYQSILSVIYIITAVTAFIANIIALIMLLGRSRKSQQLKKYLSNLAIADLFVALFSIPFTYVDLMYGQWIFPLCLCPFVHFIQIIACTVSIYTLIAIGIGR